MLRTLGRFGRHNLIGLLALFVALGGTSYAALALPRNSVGTRQIKNGAVTKRKISRQAINALKGQTGPQGLQGPAGADGKNGTNGTNGTSVTSTALSAGDANCATGGSSFISVSGTTFACNGATGPAANACQVTDGATSNTNLQTAIDAAASGDTLIVSGICHGTFSFDPGSAASLTIEGSPRATLNADHAGTVLTVGSNATLMLSNLLITGGASGDSDGGGILNSGTLTIQDTKVAHNSTHFGNGGGIQTTGPLTLEGNTQVVFNTCSNGTGGGIALGFSTLILEGNSQVDNNSAGSAGGIENNQGTIFLRDSSQVDDNIAFASYGGIDNAFGSVTMQGSSQIDGNDGGTKGGGVENGVGTLTMEGDSQVDGNHATSAPGVDGGTLDLNPNTGDTAQIADNA